MPSTGSTVSNVFQNQPGPLSLSALDANFTVEDSGRNTLLNYSNYFHDTSGAPNSITVTVPSPLVFSYIEGVQLQIKIANTNTSPTVNLNVNSLGPIPVLLGNAGIGPAVGGLLIGSIVTVIYDGTNFRIISQSTSLVLGDGFVSAPSISFSGEPTTGIYRRVAGVISFSVLNTLICDIDGALGFRAVVGGFSAPTGNQTNPSLYFTADTNTGFYNPSSDTIGAACGAAQVAQFNINGLAVTDGNPSVPSITFINDPNTGLFSNGANILGITVGGSTAISVSGASTTGVRTATFSATNKPGSGTAGPISWLPVLTSAGVPGVIPIFGL